MIPFTVMTKKILTAITLSFNPITMVLLIIINLAQIKRTIQKAILDKPQKIKWTYQISLYTNALRLSLITVWWQLQEIVNRDHQNIVEERNRYKAKNLDQIKEANQESYKIQTLLIIVEDIDINELIINF